MAAQARYELFDHTADIGVRVFGTTLADLVQPAGDGLYAVIGQLVPTGPAQPLEFDLRGEEASLLLRDYLAELLHLFERGRRIVTAVDVPQFDQQRLAVIAQTHELDAERSDYQREVKAITYHGLDIRHGTDGVEATYIVDI
ncbi:MAG: archease [Planctomycetes bacterium]|nr:archease [Planctomycetota bacterium]